MAGLLISFHWGVAVVLFMAVIPGILIRLRYSSKIYLWEKERTGLERKANYLNWILTGDVHAKEIRLFALGDLFIQQFSDLRKILRREKIEITRFVRLVLGSDE